MPLPEVPPYFQKPPYNGNHYKIVGVSSGSAEGLTKEMLTKAYRKQSLAYHPDKFGGPTAAKDLKSKEEAEACIKAISGIYQMLLETLVFKENCTPPDSERKGSQSSTWKKPPKPSVDDFTPGEQLRALLFHYVRSEHFCSYPRGESPGTPGKWIFAEPGSSLEMGCSKFSGNMAMANSLYHIEAKWNEWNQPFTVYSKRVMPYKLIQDPYQIQRILEALRKLVSLEGVRASVEIYGEHVREPKALRAPKPTALCAKPLELTDYPYKSNYVDKVLTYPNGAVAFLGRNGHGDERQLTILANGKPQGFDGENLGKVEEQMFKNRVEIARHFGAKLPQQACKVRNGR